MIRDSVSDITLGQLMIDILNHVKSSAGSEWENFYQQKVDIRYRQILQNNFNFY